MFKLEKVFQNDDKGFLLFNNITANRATSRRVVQEHQQRKSFTSEICIGFHRVMASPIDAPSDHVEHILPLVHEDLLVAHEVVWLAVVAVR